MPHPLRADLHNKATTAIIDRENSKAAKPTNMLGKRFRARPIKKPFFNLELGYSHMGILYQRHCALKDSFQPAKNNRNAARGMKRKAVGGLLA